MFRLSTIVALATVAVLKASLGVDPANSSEVWHYICRRPACELTINVIFVTGNGLDRSFDDKGTRGCDADIRDTRDKKAGQPDLMLTIGIFLGLAYCSLPSSIICPR